jgi:CRISPR/Cas system-associated exonuclease Cas4 (RecB family)
VIHAALEATYAEIADGPQKKSVSPSDLEPVARSALDEAWTAEGLPERGGEYDRAIGVVQQALDSHQPLTPGEILGVEKRLEATTSDGTRVIGVADLVHTLGDAVEVMDHKVTSRTSSTEDLAADFQLNLYAWMARSMWPEASRVYVSHHYPPLQQVVRVLSPTEAQEDAVARVEAVAEMIENDEEFTPIVGEHCTTCPYQPKCPAWNDEATLATQGF